MKFIFMFLFLSGSFFAYSIPTTLNPGDIAITGFNFKNPDEFSFVTFVDLNPGTVIYFTDCGWKDDNTFRTGEGLITYTVPSPGKFANEIITYTADPGFVTNGVGGFFGFSTDGDQILVFQGSFASPDFIFAINNNGTSWQSTASDNNSSALPLGLTNGLTAIALQETLDAKYNCAVETGNKEDIISAITNPVNWIRSDVDRFLLPGDCFRNSLPLQLISFQVIAEENQNKIFFTTQNEFDLLNYEIQRSEDGLSFYFIGFLNPTNKRETNQYFFEDTFLYSCYYRLKSVNRNGENNYYASVYASHVVFQIYDYFIFNMEGKLMSSGSEIKSEGEIISKASEFGNGIYFVKMITSKGELNRKIFIE